MKTKGITIWEMQIEKIVLGAAAAAFVVFTAIQFVGERNAVTLQGEKGKDKISPREIDQFYAARADDLLNKMHGPATDTQGIAPYKPLEPVVHRLLTTFPIPAPSLPRLVTAPTLQMNTGVGVAKKSFAVPIPAAPTDPVDCQYVDALVPEVVQQNPPLLAMFPRQAEPFDLAWVTFAAKWDRADFVKQLRGESLPSDSGDTIAVPKPWHNDHALVLDVVIEREEQVDGLWTGSTTLDPLPGHFSVRSRLTADIKAAQLVTLLQDVAAPTHETEIIQPEFYPTKNNTWVPCQPQEAALVPAAGLGPEQQAQQEVAQLKKDIEKKKTQLAQAKVQLEKAGGPLEPEPPKQPGGSPSEGGGGPKPAKPPKGGGSLPPGAGGPGGIGGGAGGDGKRTQGETEKTNSPLRIRLTKAFRTHEAQLAALEKRLESLRAASPAAPESDKRPDESQPLPDHGDGLLAIWGHDITAKPGHTYRYRMTVKLANPFYGKKLNLVDAQKPLADKLTLDSAPSAWSDGVTVSPWLCTYVVSAKPARDPASGGLGRFQLGQVNAEVYSFYNGQWRLQTFSTEPGDRIGELRGATGAQQAIDYSTNLYVLDVIENIDATDLERNAGRAAFVVLQSLDGKVTEVRDPRVEYTDARRAWLREQVRLAELAMAGP